MVHRLPAPDSAALASTLLLGLGATACGAADSGVGDPPNALLLTLDTTRADALGVLWRVAEPDPHLDRIAAEGVRYENAFTTVPLTLPAHASMMTGLYPPRHGVRDNTTWHLPEGAHTLAESARAQGIATAAFVAAVVLDAELGIAQGFDVYRGPDADGQRGTAHIGELPADVVIERSIRWLEARDRSLPFLLWIHLFDPHGPTRPETDPRTGELSLRQGYLTEVGRMDEGIGRLLQALEDQALLQSTFIAVVGDHGEGLWDHGESSHGSLCFDSTLRVPFLLRYPDGSFAGESRAAFVSVTDVAPTLAAALGFEYGGGGTDGMDGVDGIDLYRTGENEERGVYFESYYAFLSYGWSPITGWVDPNGKYVHGSRPRFADPQRGPDQALNSVERRAPLVAKALENLRRVAAGTALTREDARPSDDVDPALLERIRDLGYVGAAAHSPELPAPADDMQGRWPEDSIELERDMLNALARNEIGEHAEAERLLRRLLESDPDNPFAHNQLASSLLRQGRFLEAVPHFEIARDSGPGWASTSFNLGLCFTQLGRMPEALDAFEHARAIDVRREDDIRAFVRYLDEQGQGAQAEALAKGSWSASSAR